MKKNNANIRRGRVEIHQDEPIVERFNRTLAERLLGHQYAVEIRYTSSSLTGFAALRPLSRIPLSYRLIFP